MPNISRDLRALARLAPRAVRPEDAAAALGVEVSAVVDEGETLVGRGALEFRDGGFASGPQPDDSDASTVRDAQLAVALAETLAARGANPGDIGRLFATAGRWEEARDPLALAALRSELDPETAAELAGLAVQAQDHSPGLDKSTQGRLRLIRARHLRATGRSNEAMTELEIAVRWLEGVERVDALGFITVVADDLQAPQWAETLAALGEMEAWAAGEPAKVGSMLTLRGRMLSRIGFPREADRVIEVGLELLDLHGHEVQRFYGRLNRAWVQLDRGEVRSAEAGFSRLREEAKEIEGPVSQADKAVYWARAAFAAGRPADALEAVAGAEAAADEHNAPVLAFLAGIARAEGALYFERFDDALTAADRVLELALAHLPAWENRARALRTRALTGLQRLDEAAAEVAAALAATPEGVDGLRLRKEIEVDRLLALPAAAAWPKSAAEDLTDLLLQARWHLAALDLLIERAKREKDDELALHAAGLAIDLGIPMVATRAAHAADLWSDPAGQAVAFAAQGVVHHLPESWEEEWTTLPHVAAALAVEVTDDQAATDTLTAQWAEVVSEAGLAGYEVLSPAQRRTQGLVRRRAVASWGRRIAVAAAIVLVAGGVSLGVAVAFGPDAPPEAAATTTGPTTTTTLALEDRLLAAPADRFIGTAVYRADAARSGVVPGVTGPARITGFYWKFPTADQIVASPVVFGQWVFVASTDNRLYAIDMTDGTELWSYDAGEALRATAAAAEVRSVGVGGQGGTRSIVAFGDAGGTVYFRDVLTQGGGPFWSVPTTGSIVGSPLIVDSRVIVASSRPDSAEVISLLPLSQEVEWTFPAIGDEPMGPIQGAPAYHDGVIYVSTTGVGGSLYLIDAATGEGLCQSQPLGDLAFPPMIVDGVVYVTTSERFIYPFVAGSCSTKPANRQFQYDFPGGVTAAPVVVGDLMVVPNGSNLVAIDLTSADRGASLWIFPSGALIQSSPVVSGDTIYFGNNSGTVFAVALNSDDPQGELLWSWKTGSSVVSSVAVLDGVVFVTSTNGIVYAIGESAEAATTDTTVPDTTVPDTTEPGTTAPGTTEPDTTEPDTTTTTLVPPVEVGGTL